VLGDRVDVVGPGGELVVRLVDHHEDVLGHAVQERGELVAVDGGPGRVVRRADPDQPRLRPDGGRERAEVDRALGGQRGQHGLRAGPARVADVGRERGPRGRDLVARPEQAGVEVADDAVASVAHGDLLGREAVQRGQPLDERGVGLGVATDARRVRGDDLHGGRERAVGGLVRRQTQHVVSLSPLLVGNATTRSWPL
jgi:hypothetical protein